MKQTIKPPLGVMPYYIWREKNRDPGLRELLSRYIAVSAAVDRYRAAGLPFNLDWLRELGTCDT